MIDVILVPQGIEDRTVSRAIASIEGKKPLVIAIPIGNPVAKNFSLPLSLFSPDSKVLVTGLCGSLSPTLSVGEVVVYQDCIRENSWEKRKCDRLFEKYSTVTGLTSTRLIYLATEKQQLANKYQADVVDMEGFFYLELLQKQGATVSILRVVSDDCFHDLPDLNPAISLEGKIDSAILAKKMLRQPRESMRLIKDSLLALKVLEKTIEKIFSM